MTEPIIQIENIHKRFHTLRGTVHALNDVSLSIMPAEVIVVVGPSGSGKSTLLRCINRLETFDSGSIIVDNIPLRGARNINKVRAEVGMVFQQFNLFPDRTALDNIILAQRVVRKRRKSEAVAKAHDLLAKVGIPEKADAYPTQLSGGQQQRVAIARALATGNPVLLADEPTGELDFRTGIQILDLLQKQAAEGKTVLVVTHNREISRIADRVIELSSGRIISDGAPRDGKASISELQW